MLSSIYVSAQRSVENAGFGMKLFGMSTVLNTGLNYLLIFGKCGLACARAFEGAAVATLLRPHRGVRSSAAVCARPQQDHPAYPVARLLPPRLGHAPAVRQILLARDPQ